MTLGVGRTSRILFGEARRIDGVEHFDTLELPLPVVRPDDHQHIVQSGDRIDTIAQTYYQDPTLGWVICLANDIERPPLGMNPGTLLRIPSPRYVRETYIQGIRPRVGR